MWSEQSYDRITWNVKHNWAPIVFFSFSSGQTMIWVRSILSKHSRIWCKSGNCKNRIENLNIFEKSYPKRIDWWYFFQFLWNEKKNEFFHFKWFGHIKVTRPIVETINFTAQSIYVLFILLFIFVYGTMQHRVY